VLLTHPFERIVTALRDRGYTAGKGCRVTLERVRARCPNHADHNPSLVVTRLNDRALMRCFGGCRTSEVMQRLGLRMADLFAGPRDRAAKPKIIAAYDYYNLAGELIAQKVRLYPKSFRWRRPDSTGRREWIWGLDAREPGLYRLPELIECSEIYLCEGEKAVDYLWNIGIPATCPPVGASKWDAAWSESLVAVGCHDLIILADHDAAGEQHAERVAAAVLDVVICPTVLQFQGLPRGGDAFDWLSSGRTAKDLRDVVLRSAPWSPEAKEVARAERRKQLARERQQRCRLAKKARHAPYVSDGHATNVTGPDGHARHAVTLPNVLLNHVTRSSIQ
jgi:putative DNA primase/helicase